MESLNISKLKGVAKNASVFEQPSFGIGIVVFQWILFTVVCQIVDVFGIATNIINIVCFIKQGFKDPVNVSLLGLAVSDIGCISTLVWTNICFTPAFNSAELPFDPPEFQYLTGAMPHTTFTRITSWITALITLERCLCITAPLAVKSIVTTRRVSAIVIFVFVILITSVAPLYVVNRIGWKFFPHRNKILLGLVYTNDRDFVEHISFIINNAFIPLTAFVIIIVCTITLVVKLRSKAKWRKTSVASAQADSISNRNHRVAKMIVVISATFIACYVPFSIIFIAMSLEPGLSLDGKYIQTLIIIGGLGFFLESINSSVNIFIYYYMSSRYREVFLRVFRMRKDKPTDKAQVLQRKTSFKSMP